MKNKFAIILILSAGALFGQAKTSEIAGRPGAFSRLGFGPRGMGMGNAMSAVAGGSLVSYYNPASIVYQEGNNISASYSFLSLDRSLNFLNFTRHFNFGKKDDGTPKSTAGFSAGIINAGVSKIDGRDKHGLATGDLSTSENQFFIGFANKFSDKFSAGVNLKMYYYKLYEDVTSTSIGIDIGILYRYSKNLSFAAVVQDFNAKYKWDTGNLYGQDGAITQDKFPLLIKIGSSYNWEKIGLLTTVEFESSNAGTKIIRFGAEYEIIKNLMLRGGMDKWNLNNSDFPVRPSLGFSYFYNLNNWIVGVDYAFVIEPYSSFDSHIVGINILL